MEDIFKSEINPDTLKNIELKYQKDSALGNLSTDTTFQYATCLVQSKYRSDWIIGRDLLKDIFKSDEKPFQRDCLYYIAFADCKLKNFDDAISVCQKFLLVEKGNSQIMGLMELIKKKKREAAINDGLIVVGTTGAAVGLVLLGAGLISLFKK